MKLLILILFLINPIFKTTLNNEIVECEIIDLHSYTIDTITYDTLEFRYLAKTKYCNLVLKFIKGHPDRLDIKRIKIGGKYKLLLKFLPEPNNKSTKEFKLNQLYFYASDLKYGSLGLYFNTDSLYELDYYYINNFKEDSMAFNYMPLNVTFNYINDSLIIYQPQ